jgi:hypothetical protein
MNLIYKNFNEKEMQMKKLLMAVVAIVFLGAGYVATRVGTEKIIFPDGNVVYKHTGIGDVFTASKRGGWVESKIKPGEYQCVDNGKDEGDLYSWFVPAKNKANKGTDKTILPDGSVLYKLEGVDDVFCNSKKDVWIESETNPGEFHCVKSSESGNIHYCHILAKEENGIEK